MSSVADLTSVFFKELFLRDIRCFKGDFRIILSDKQQMPARWTVLLGNNNTGKTTMIKIISAISYPEILSGYLNKYRRDRSISIQKYVNASKKNKKKYRSGAQTITDWLSNAGEEPTVGTNIFSPYFDYSMYVKRAKIKIDLDKPQGQKYLTLDYISRNSLIFRDNLIIHAYGINRKISDVKLSDSISQSSTSNLYDSTDLLNIEEWLLQTDFATKVGLLDNQKRAEEIYDKIKSLLIHSDLLPDVSDLRVNSSEDLQPYIEIKSNNSWVRIKDLGYGYQATLAWVSDLAKRMFDRYPELENPLHGPAIVLVDEIDLHLHPDWQRKIISYLSDLFPNTQFIVTAHSPLIVQSAENVNLIMLEKDDETGSINIRQQFGSFQGWTVEEILRELMDMGEKTRSDKYLDLMRQFEDALLMENYVDAKAACDELDKILSPTSHQRKVLSIQLSSITPVHS